MDVLSSLGQFAVCAAVVVVAGTILTKSADAIAEITGFGRLLVGSILLAGATSLPELTVDISAIRMGAPDLAIGDLLGSCLANLLILAILDLMQKSTGGMLSRRSARHALSGSVSVALLAVAGLALLTSSRIPNITWLGVGPGLWALAAVYLGGVRVVYLDQRASLAEAPEEIHADAKKPGAFVKAVVAFAVAAGVILLVGPFMAHAAESFAKATGLGRTFVGTTLVALSTSLPEFVASLAAVRMGAYDLAIGNIFGSNAFNMMLLFPLDFVQKGSLLAVVSANHCITCFAAILATQTAILGQLYNVEGRRRFVDPDAWLVAAIVVGGLAIVYYVG
ncbi:MAG: sodium:calcium antiporter [Planctomycetaceae bacterium]|nr:sodium:calcium antiporter [Planctomycetaceae bacterium]